MTVPECFWLLEDPDKRGKNGVENQEYNEILEALLQYEQLTPLEKLDEKLDNMQRV